MKKLSVFQNAVFNSTGAILYSLCQWAVTVAAVRISGNFENSGILQLAISVTNIFYTVATYVPRTYLISDAKGEYSPGEYIGMRLISSFAALFLCIVYAFISGYRGTTVACIALYMLFKVSEAMSDVFRAYSQMNYRMDFEFVSYLLRGVTSLTAFVIVLKISGNILISIVFMALTGLTVVFIYDVAVAKNFVPVKPKFNRKKMKIAGKVCLPIVVASFIFTAYSTLPRQFLQSFFGTEALGSYASVATPVVFVQLLSTSIFNPMLMKFTDLCNEKKTREIWKFFITIFACLSGICILSFAGAYVLAEKAYIFLYGDVIKEYCSLVYAVILCAVLYAACWLMDNVLIIIRRQWARMLSAFSGLVMIIIFGKRIVMNYGMNGVSYATALAYSSSIMISVIAILAGGLFRKDA